MKKVDFRLGRLLAGMLCTGCAQGTILFALTYYLISDCSEVLYIGCYTITTIVATLFISFCGRLADSIDRNINLSFINSTAGCLLIAIVFFVPQNDFVHFAVFAFIFLFYYIHQCAFQVALREAVYSKDTKRIQTKVSYTELTTQLSSVAAIAVNLIVSKKNEPAPLEVLYGISGCLFLAASLLFFFNRKKETGRECLTIAEETYLSVYDSVFFGLLSLAIFACTFVLVPVILKNKGIQSFGISDILIVTGSFMGGFFYAMGHTQKLYKNIVTVFVATLVLLLTINFYHHVILIYMLSFTLGLLNSCSKIVRTVFIINTAKKNSLGRTNRVFGFCNNAFKSGFLTIIYVIALMRPSESELMLRLVSVVPFFFLTALLMYKERLLSTTFQWVRKLKD